MRSFHSAAAALCAPATSQIPRSTQRSLAQPPCFICAHRIPPSPRHQSTSTSTSTSSDADDSAPTRSLPKTHFDFFPTTLPSGPPPAGHFTIDTTALRREFLQLQGRAHPDLHPPEHKAQAQALSARINEAYKTLQSPLLRAQYLLSLRGFEVAEDETAKVDDAELLMEVLEARERIEEAGCEEELFAMKGENEQRIAESVKVLEDAFARDDVQAAKEEAVRLRYWINIKECLDDWEKGKPVELQH